MEIPQDVVERYDMKYYHENNEYCTHGRDMFTNLPSDGELEITENVINIKYPSFLITFWRNSTIIHMTIYPVELRN